MGAQAPRAFTLVSFLNTTKYPPSLLFLLMTLGPALLILRAVDGAMPRLLRPALVIGKVPLFYFVLHLPLIHLLAVVICYVRYGVVALDVRVARPRRVSVHPAARLGISLPWIYLIWVVVVVIVPLCRVVRGAQAAAERRVAELSVIAWTDRR